MCILTGIYIIWTISLTSPLLPPLVLQFCWRGSIKNNKKNIEFLIVWDKDSYIRRFFLLFPCICVSQPKLVHLYQTSLLLPSPLSIVASASLRLVYLFLSSEYINHIQVFGFLPFIYPSHVRSLLSVWPTSNNITAFVLGL
jgi:hypothetical protein